MRKSLESRVVIVPSKSEKKMNLGFVFIAGRVEGAILAEKKNFCQDVRICCFGREDAGFMYKKETKARLKLERSQQK